jgi:hypothetical protein
MADQSFKTNQTGSGTSQGSEKKSVTEQALAVGRDLKDKAVGLAGTSTETVKEQASDLVDAAKDVASQATDKFKETVDGQKAAGADYVGNLANTIRRAAREFDGDLPIAGVYIRKAASRVEDVSNTIRTGNIKELVRGAQSFARRQPTAFLGMAVLAGFGMVRFLKSSSDDTQTSSAGRASNGKSAPKGASSTQGESRGYRDEFTK